MDYSLNEAAELLDISPRTLRRWNEHFDALLSECAHQAHMAGGSTAPLRYTEADIAILWRAKALIWSGCSYDEVLRQLTGAQAEAQSDDQAAKQCQSLNEQPSRNRGEQSQQLQLVIVISICVVAILVAIVFVWLGKAHPGWWR
jgi:DNA-binding transcriptional MerR regulator